MKCASHTARLRWPTLLVLAALGSSACGPDLRRYPLAPPLWEDPDRNHVPKRPSEFFSGQIADAVDQSGFRPLSRLFWFPLSSEARNVNAVDEVPNSSWFTNRIGLFPMTPAQAAKGACKGPGLAAEKGAWIITGAKPDGANPGFIVKVKSGTYLLKFDGDKLPQKTSSADVIGSKIFHAAGFNAPCNEIIYFKKSILKIGKNATAKSSTGKKTKLAWKAIHKVLRKAFRLKNGLLRAAASKFVPGKPLGPFRYESTRGDDPNDVIPHEHRRELRASRLLGAWLNHWDSREQNSLDVWATQGGRSFVKHYFIDFGDCLGARWDNEAFTRRIGHSYYFDLGHIVGDFLSLGMIRRPWDRKVLNPVSAPFGYFGAKHFVASKWKAGYANPAHDNMTFRDALWMVRIISRFTDAHLSAIVASAKLRDPRSARYLLDTLIARRNTIVREYLTRYAPLDRFRLVRRKPGSLEQSLCFEDLAVRHRLAAHTKVLYKFRFYVGRRQDKLLGWLQFRPDPDHPARSCVVLPVSTRRPADSAPKNARDNHPKRYGVLKIFIHQRAAVKPTSSMWLHLYDLGPKRGFRLVGVDRQPKPAIPANY
jgi:hypothetical protein